MTDMPGGSSYFDNDMSMSNADAWRAPPDSVTQPNVGTPDISMEGGDTQNVWAGVDRPQRVTDIKRVAVANPARDEMIEARQSAEAAREKAKAVVRQKRELESKLHQAQEQILALQQDQKRRDGEWEQHRQLWGRQWEKLQTDLAGTFQHQLEEQRVQNFNQVKEQAAAYIAERESEMQNLLAKQQEKGREEQEALMREKEAIRLEQEKMKADHETKLAAFHARFHSRNQNPQHPQDDEMEGSRFPEGPPGRTPQFVPEATREDRRIQAVIRQGAGRLPTVLMTPPVPSAAPTPEQDTPQAQASLQLDLEDPVVQQRLKAFLGNAVAEMGLKSPRKPKKAKRGAMTVLTQARRGQQQQISVKDDQRWKTIMRERWRNNTGLDRAKDFFDYEGLDKRTMLRCEAGDAAPETSGAKLYFGTGWATCVWNTTIIQKSIQEVLQKRSEDPGHYDVPDVSNDYLQALFYNLLKEARAEWSRNQPRLGESVAEARVRVDAYNKDRQRKNVASARKASKLSLRLETTKKMVRICLARQDQDGAEAWKWLGEVLLAQLDVGGMSSEEDEAAEVRCGEQVMVSTVHAIKICPWRMQKIDHYFEVIDKTTEKRMTKVAQKRVRVRTGNKRSTSDPPLGLPRALYDAAWLSEQKKFVPNIEEQLQISNEEFQLMEVTMFAGDDSN